MLKLFLVLVLLASSLPAFGQCAPVIDCPFDVGLASFKGKTKWIWKKGKDGVMRRVIVGLYYHHHDNEDETPSSFWAECK